MAFPPSKADWYAPLIEWSAYVDTYMVNQGLAAETALGATYYDGQLNAYWLADYTGDTTTYYARADHCNTAYAVNYLRKNNWQAPAYWAFGEGIAERFIRQGDAAALTDLQNLCANATYHASGSLPVSNVTRHELSREWAYSLANLLQLKRVGSVSGAQQALIDSRYSDSLLIIGDWAIGQTASYFRPFMGGLTARALVMFYELEADAGEKAAILSALESLATFAWNSCWDATAKAFDYTDRVVTSASDVNPATDLNMLIAPLYAWLWAKTGNVDWYTKSSQIIDGALVVYTGAFWTSGPFLGSRSATNPSGKQFNQQLIWSPKFWSNYETQQPGAESGEGQMARANSGLILLGCGSGGIVPDAPVITVEPTNQTVTEGNTANFSVTATGTGLTYQWYKNDVAIVGATNNSYTTPVTVLGDNGAIYHVVVSNGGGTDTSADATLTVNAIPVDFNAATYGTVLQWLNFRDPTKVLNASGTQALDGEGIATITDSGPNGYTPTTQGTSTARPTLKTNIVAGNQVARCDGGDGFSVPLASGGAITKNRAGITAVWTYCASSVASAARAFTFSEGGGGSDPRIRAGFLGGSGNVTTQTTAQDGGTMEEDYSSVAPHYPAVVGSWHVWIFTWDFTSGAAKINAWRNGVQTMADVAITSTGNTSNTDCSTASATAVLGTFFGLTGDITDMIFYDGVMSAPNRAALNTALGAEVGLTL